MPRGCSSCGQCDGPITDFSRAGQAIHAWLALQLLPELQAPSSLLTQVGAQHERPAPLAIGNKNAIGFRLAHQEAARERNFPANTTEGAASTSSRRCLIYSPRRRSACSTRRRMTRGAFEASRKSRGSGAAYARFHSSAQSSPQSNSKRRTRTKPFCLRKGCGETSAEAGSFVAIRKKPYMSRWMTRARRRFGPARGIWKSETSHHAPGRAAFCRLLITAQVAHAESNRGKNVLRPNRSVRRAGSMPELLRE